MKFFLRDFNNRQTLSLALGRWGLGLMLLTSGISKFPKLPDFVNGYLVTSFAKTILPEWLVIPYGYSLPFIEVAVGLFLILGWYRTITLFITGLTFMSLAFGQLLLKQHNKVADIFLYLFFVVFILYFTQENPDQSSGAKQNLKEKT